MGEKINEWNELTQDGREAFSQSRFDIAEQKFLAALHLAEELPAYQEQLEDSIQMLAFFYWAMERYSEAEPYWIRGLSFVKSRCGAMSREAGTYTYNIAEMIYRPQGKIEEADNFYRRAEVICGVGFFPPTDLSSS